LAVLAGAMAQARASVGQITGDALKNAVDNPAALYGFA